MNNPAYDAIFVGGGPASFFAALRLASHSPGHKIAIIERGKELLQKVKISGGGRCNLTNVIHDPLELSLHYPRGQKALIGPFHQFNSKDTVDWFVQRGVKIKTEQDGRMFPVSDDSATIVNCLIKESKKHHIEIITRENIKNIIFQPERKWSLEGNFQSYITELLFLGSGSNPRIWEMLGQIGLKITKPVPSLFTFNIKHPLLSHLAGLSVPMADISVAGSKLKSSGPMLITHRGLSGPAVLRLSAWGAIELAELNYNFQIQVNWLPGEDIGMHIHQNRQNNPKKQVSSLAPGPLPARLWKSMVEVSDIPHETRWADLNKRQTIQLMTIVHAAAMQVNSKSTFKEEFVTAGGVDLREIDFKTFSSKKNPGLFMAGEILNIDGITGGFNFQAAWTGGWIAGTAMAEKLSSRS